MGHVKRKFVFEPVQNAQIHHVHAQSLIWALIHSIASNDSADSKGPD